MDSQNLASNSPSLKSSSIQQSDFDDFPIVEGAKIGEKTSFFSQCSWRYVSWKTAVFASFVSIIYFLLIWSAETISHSNRTSNASNEELWNCGNAIKTAKANDCVFDIMRYAWMPKKCYHESVAKQEFSRFEDLRWYESLEASSEISRDVILQGLTPTTYTTLEFQEYQCSYGWKILAGSSASELVDSVTMDLNNTESCVEMIFEAPNDTRNPTAEQLVRLDMAFLSCIYLNS